MAKLKEVEVWYAKVHPDRPNARFNKENPTWEIQIRTSEQKKAKEWEENHIKVTAVIPEEEGAKPYWRANLRKRTIKADGTNAAPVEVIDSGLESVDPSSIGNGSIANIRLYQYEYTKSTGGTGIASVLMGIQLKKHILYTHKPREDDFKDEGETEIIPEAVEDGVDAEAAHQKLGNVVIIPPEDDKF